MHERVRTVALLSTLRVLDRARIQKERKLPAPGDVLVQAGDTVNADTVICLLYTSHTFLLQMNIAGISSKLPDRL